MTGTRKEAKRLAIAVFLVLPISVAMLATPSTAVPNEVSKQQVLDAKRNLRDVQHQLEVASERYNTANERFLIARRQLAEARDDKRNAESRAAAARAALSARAVEAYTGAGSNLDVLLGAKTIADFSDQMEFMGAVAQSDAQLAAAQESAQREAAYAEKQLNEAVAERKTQLKAMSNQRARIERLVTRARREASSTLADRNAWLAYLDAQRAAAAERDRQARIDNADRAGNDGVGSTSDSGSSGFTPPANASGAAIAIAAAKSVLGTQYVWAAASPSIGFDCSGLTSWAWAQAGVYLPHSSEMQYYSLPHVSRSDIQPGDLLFFYRPISHVAMYIGGKQMIHARHPGPGGEVQISTMSRVWMDDFVGASRPS